MRAEVSAICVCTRSTHIDQKRRSLNQQKVQLHEPWDAKLEELKNPANLMRNSQSKENFPFKKSTSRRQYSL
jgi:hypothetical protein